jgi:hypothetical protein
MSLAVILMLTSCSNNVTGKVWPHAQNEVTHNYPERPYISNKGGDGLTRGIVFSGGGSRSATLTLGQLRALNELGYLDKVGYMAAVSGGSWGSLPYIFYDRELSSSTACHEMQQKNRALLGEMLLPSELTNEVLKDKKNLQYIGELGEAITKGTLFHQVVKAWFTGRGDESFSYAIGSVFLEPFGLNEDKYVTLNIETRDDLLRINDLSPDDFYLPSPCTPFYIVGGTVQNPQLSPTLRLADDIYPLEITPMYSGIPSSVKSLGHDIRKYGGGFIETALYNSDAPKHAPMALDSRGINKSIPIMVTARIPNKYNRFSLNDFIGVSGAAPQNYASSKFKLSGILSNLGLPEHNHWPVTDASYYTGKNYEPNHGDGGNIENIGLIPLLARGVDKILVFVNTQEDFNPGFSYQSNNCESQQIKDDCTLSNESYVDHDTIPKYAMYSDLQDYFVSNPERPKNVVFNKTKLIELYSAFEEDKKAGRPLVHCDTYSVLKNPYYGVFPKPDYRPKICWFYNDLFNDWREEVKNVPGVVTSSSDAPCSTGHPNDLRCICNKRPHEEQSNSDGQLEACKILKAQAPYKNIPHSKTFLQQWHLLKVIDRNRRHVIVESNISAWSVMESKEELKIWAN